MQKGGDVAESTRITVTLPEDDYAVLRRLATLQGGTMSSIVRELVAAVTPALGRTADLIERASGAQQEVLAGIAAAVAASEESVTGTLDAAQEAFAQMLADSEALLDQDPPSSNTGGRTLHPHPSPAPRGTD
jgi:hypothetical protein